MGGRFAGMNRWLRYSLRECARGAFVDLGYAAVVLAFVVASWALEHSANAFPTEPSLLADALGVARQGAGIAAAFATGVPILVVACNLAPRRGVWRYACLAVSTPLCVLACVESPLPNLLAGVTFSASDRRQVGELVVLLVVLFEFRRQAFATASELARAEIDSLTADARLRDASLRVLRSQIAPHFLFNTLANVRRLARIDRAGAAAMLGDLVRYFSVTLARRDEPLSKLGDEARLIDAYLRIHRMRMGTRLAYAIEVPEDLADTQVPAMMLLTLVENAIKHGVNPLVEGGFVRLRAERRGDTLRVEISDNGRGLAAAEGHGMGLANVRARLSMLYGPRAMLQLEHGRPRGFMASILLPLPKEA
jgi:signal transduction histidine kinase